MSLYSMTGFARSQGQDAACTWTWELKSVNGRGREVRCRLPYGFDVLEAEVRNRASKRIDRGNLSVNLSIVRQHSSSRFSVNQEALGQLIALMPSLREQMPDAQPPTIDGLLALKGVVETVEEETTEEAQQQLFDAVLKDLDKALDGLVENRAGEGDRLTAMLNTHLDTIAGLREEAAKLAATQPDALFEKLKGQVAVLMDGTTNLPEDRLVQEAAILATKADVREELDRLSAHVEAAHDLMKAGSPVGRKLDFLCQEFNREANTLCSKSSDVELTRIGLDLKAVIDQLREQVQNVE